MKENMDASDGENDTYVAGIVDDLDGVDDADGLNGADGEDNTGDTESLVSSNGTDNMKDTAIQPARMARMALTLEKAWSAGTTPTTKTVTTV